MEVFSLKQQQKEFSQKQKEMEKIESLSSSSYSSSSFNTLCNTSTSYRLLPTKIDLKSAVENMINSSAKTVKFTDSSKSKESDASKIVVLYLAEMGYCY